MKKTRICSLLPSATEIVCALGLIDQLVGVTHECDFPDEVRAKPHVTTSVIDSEGLTAGQIDEAVRDSLAEQETIYDLRGDLLDALEPDVILTQELCDVCAVGLNEVKRVVETLPSRPRLVSLEPHTVDEMLGSILQVGSLAGEEGRAQQLVDDLNSRLTAVRTALRGRPTIRVLTLEWVDPLFVGGHWVPEMVQIAGGVDILGQAGKPSREVSWAEIVEAKPEVVVAMPCGFGLERSILELRRAHLPPAWNELEAVKNGDVYVVDGSSYFNRPGPRLIDGVEILASILHPEVVERAPDASYIRYSMPVPERA